MKSSSYTVVLSHTSHPGNVGACARAMKTMGITDLRLVNCVDYKNETAYNRSSGAEDVLFNAQEFSSLEEALSDCHLAIGTTARSRKIPNPPSLCATKLPVFLQDNQSSSPIALVFGNEQNGLDNAEISLCHMQVTVPTNPDFSSLNLASCVQIITFLVMQMGSTLSPPETHQEIASHQKISAMTSTLSQYAFSKTHKKSEIDAAKFRQLLFRLRPNDEEIDFLHGIFKRLLKTDPMS